MGWKSASLTKPTGDVRRSKELEDTYEKGEEDRWPTGQPERERARDRGEQEQKMMEGDKGQASWPWGAYWISKWPHKQLGYNSTCCSWVVLIHCRVVHLRIFCIQIEIYTQQFSESCGPQCSGQEHWLENLTFWVASQPHHLPAVTTWFLQLSKLWCLYLRCDDNYTYIITLFCKGCRTLPGTEYNNPTGKADGEWTQRE